MRVTVRRVVTLLHRGCIGTGEHHEQGSHIGPRGVRYGTGGWSHREPGVNRYRTPGSDMGPAGWSHIGPRSAVESGDELAAYNGTEPR